MFRIVAKNQQSDTRMRSGDWIYEVRDRAGVCPTGHSGVRQTGHSGVHQTGHSGVRQIGHSRVRQTEALQTASRSFWAWRA